MSVLWFIPGVLLKLYSTPLLASDVTLELNSWKWIAQVHFCVDHPVKSFPNDPVLGKLRRTDRLSFSSAAPRVDQLRKNQAIEKVIPIYVEVKEVAADATSGSVDREKEKDQFTEHERLMMIHHFLTARLIVAVNASDIQVPSFSISPQILEPTVQTAFVNTQEDVSSQPGTSSDYSTEAKLVPHHSARASFRSKSKNRKRIFRSRTASLTTHPKIKTENDYSSVAVASMPEDTSLSSSSSVSPARNKISKEINSVENASPQVVSFRPVTSQAALGNQLLPEALPSETVSISQWVQKFNDLQFHSIHTQMASIQVVAAGRIRAAQKQNLKQPLVDSQSTAGADSHLDSQISDLDLNLDQLNQDFTALQHQVRVAQMNSIQMVHGHAIQPNIESLTSTQPQVQVLAQTTTVSQVMGSASPQNVLVTTQASAQWVPLKPNSSSVTVAQMSTQPSASMTTQKEPSQKVTTQQPAVLAMNTHSESASSLVLQSSEPTHSETSQENQPTEPLTRYSLIEAFSKSEMSVARATVDSTQMRTIESIGSSNEPIGLHLSQVDGYWNTLTRESTIPMLSYETLAAFETFPGIVQNPEAGIVVVKVPAGWEIEYPYFGLPPDESLTEKEAAHLKERSQNALATQTLFFDLDRNYRGRDLWTQGGEVVFFNVPAGQNFVRLALQSLIPGQNSALSGGTDVEVFPKTLTYLDLTQFGVRTLQGKVSIKNSPVASDTNLAGHSSSEESLDSESENSPGSLPGFASLAQGRVRVIGAKAGQSQFGPDGTFKIENVCTFSNYPIHIETDAVEKTETGRLAIGRVHRYQILPSEAHRLNLDRFSIERILTWQDKTQGPMDDPRSFGENAPDESKGVAVAYASKIMAAHPNTSLTPVIQLALHSENLFPELYAGSVKACTLSKRDEIEPPVVVPYMDGSLSSSSSPLNKHQTRVFGYELPDGLLEMKLIDDSQQKVWSTFFYSSPQVVNVIRPLGIRSAKSY